MEILDKETNAMHARFSSNRPPRHAAAVGTLILLASSLLWLNAATINGGGALIGPPFTAETGDQVLVAVSNVGSKPIRFRVLLLRASDFEPIVTGDVQVLQPRTTHFEDISFGLGSGFIPIIQFQSSGKTEVKTSLQVIEPGGATRFYLDDFAS